MMKKWWLSPKLLFELLHQSSAQRSRAMLRNNSIISSNIIPKGKIFYKIFSRQYLGFCSNAAWIQWVSHFQSFSHIIHTSNGASAAEEDRVIQNDTDPIVAQYFDTIEYFSESKYFVIPLSMEVCVAQWVDMLMIFADKDPRIHRLESYIPRTQDNNLLLDLEKVLRTATISPRLAFFKLAVYLLSNNMDFASLGYLVLQLLDFHTNRDLFEKLLKKCYSSLWSFAEALLRIAVRATDIRFTLYLLRLGVSPRAILAGGLSSDTLSLFNTNDIWLITDTIVAISKEYEKDLLFLQLSKLNYGFDSDLIAQLIRRGLDPYEIDPSASRTTSLFWIAVRHDHIASMQLILDNSRQGFRRIYDGEPSIFDYAAMQCSLDVICFLVANGPDYAADFKTEDGTMDWVGPLWD